MKCFDQTEKNLIISITVDFHLLTFLKQPVPTHECILKMIILQPHWLNVHFSNWYCNLLHTVIQQQQPIKNSVSFFIRLRHAKEYCV